MIQSMFDKFGQDVTIKRKTITNGGYTGDTVTWATFASVEGVIRPLTGSETAMLEKLTLKADLVLYIDYITITERDTVYTNGKYYDITYIKNPMMANEFLQVYMKASDNFGNEI